MTSAQRALATDFVPGTRLGNYEVVRKLAVGGMAELYLARVRSVAGFEKLVVIKRVLPYIAGDPKVVAMFLEEARLAASLEHPNVVHVYDVGTIGTDYFFAMEYVHGVDARTIRIAARKAGQPIPLIHALAIVHGIASPLHYAHDKTDADGHPLGLVHRDVSPANVLVSYAGAVKLVDFGIAKATLRSSKTRTGTLKGKIDYMSPEQCRGQDCDRRSDLFALGIVLYELTVGRRPFRGENDFAILDQIIHEDPAAPTTVAEGFPVALERIILRLMRRDPAERYQSAEELLRDLDAFIATHGLRVSTIDLGRWVRSLFAERVDAWERAEAEGVTLADYVMTQTGLTLDSGPVMTPISAVMPQDPQAIVRTEPVRKISRSKWPAIAIGASVLALAGVLAFVIWQRSGGAPAAAAAAAPDPQQRQEPAKPDPVQAPTPEEKARSASPAKPEEPALEPSHETTAATEAVPVPPAAAPVTRAVPTTPVRPVKPAKPDVKPEPKPDPKPPEDKPWDRDSPFLPPAS